MFQIVHVQLTYADMEIQKKMQGKNLTAVNMFQIHDLSGLN